MYYNALIEFCSIVDSWLIVYGSSLSILSLACVGSLVSVLELKSWTLRKIARVLLFNTLIGSFGGPILLKLIEIPVDDRSPNILFVTSFLLGWAAHSVITEFRDILLAFLKRHIERITK
ncbi:hypothetical protein [Pseudovibrio sp. POLY-S9]|uniref:hypothetical protein n=1 Tax=Pseudovibrio sp. POLY-S9 TaxID=1576596 RepID=UPI00070DCC96|nr:hypothetical protein [Pseudovibrio sp. POLY-S9]